jgi:hypothetical protein
MSYAKYLESYYINQEGSDKCWPECPAHIDSDDPNGECICAELDEEWRD